jgi:3-oxoacyl-[acyl-carrier protein] reductase
MTRRVALVTGGSRGIGRACAMRLARDGFDLAINFRQADEAAEEVARAVRALGREAICLAADVADAGAVDRMVSEVVRVWGRVDVLVTNAGTSAVRAVEELDTDEWDRVLDVNLRGTFLCAQRVIPVMKTQGSGRIIMMSSQAGLSGGVFIGVHYAVSKAGVICLAKSLAKQLAPFGIRVNTVAPGIVETDMVASYPPDRLAALVASVPLGRIGTAEDVAEAVGFLASPASDYITGATLHVNGGLYMP